MIDITEKKSDYTLPQEPHYVAKNASGWSTEMLGLEAVDGSDADHTGILGLPIINFTIEAADILKARVRNKKGKWLPFKTGFGMNDAEALGDDTPITGIEILGNKFIFSVHAKGGSWLPSVVTSEVEGEVQVIAGSTIDAIWIDKI